MDFAFIISMWPSAAELARDINVSDVTVRAWRRRNSIPHDLFGEIEKAAKRRGLKVDRALLSKIEDSRPPRRRSAYAAPAGARG